MAGYEVKSEALSGRIYKPLEQRRIIQREVRLVECPSRQIQGRELERSRGSRPCKIDVAWSSGITPIEVVPVEVEDERRKRGGHGV